MEIIIDYNGSYHRDERTTAAAALYLQSQAVTLITIKLAAMTYDISPLVVSL